MAIIKTEFGQLVKNGLEDISVKKHNKNINPYEKPSLFLTFFTHGILGGLPSK
jgi:hypothetical protein